MDNRPIGVFDSGLGGLTAVKELIRILPQENIVYFGDTGRVPYGSRSRDTIIRYATQDIAFLRSKQVKIVIAACGTVSSVAQDIGDHLPVPFTGVLGPTAAAVSYTHLCVKTGTAKFDEPAGRHGGCQRPVLHGLQQFHQIWLYQS